MSKKELIIPLNAPLSPKDSDNQTHGCRHSNPDICGNNGLPGICAFVSDDCVCRKPSRSWKKQFQKLKD